MSAACASDSIYIVANFKSSKDTYFPNNVPEHFRLKLSKPLILTGGRWLVALSEIEIVNVLPAEGQKRLELLHPVHYQVNFAPCEGLLINGKPSRTVRWIPYKANYHHIYVRPFYVPVQPGYMDTVEVCISTIGNEPVKIRHLTNTCITCTFHFKKTHMLDF